MPDYTRSEEIFNMVTHIVGGGFAIVMLASCIVVAIMHHSLAGAITGSIFALSSLLLYTMSSIYHGLVPETAKKVMQVLDHCAVYVMIAGTYTPILVCGIVPHNALLGWIMLAAVWAFAGFAIALTAIDLKKYRVFSMICYLGLGWSALIVLKPLYEIVGLAAFLLLLIGGILYTIGAVLYGMGRAKRYMHSVWHIFVLAGNVMHFFCIILYII